MRLDQNGTLHLSLKYFYMVVHGYLTPYFDTVCVVEKTNKQKKIPGKHIMLARLKMIAIQQSNLIEAAEDNVFHD